MSARRALLSLADAILRSPHASFPGPYDAPLGPIARRALTDPHERDRVAHAAVLLQGDTPEVPADADPLIGQVERLAEVRCGGLERCFLGAQYTVMGWAPVFLRDVPLVEVTRKQVSMARLWAVVSLPHLAVPRQIQESFGGFTVLFDRIAGRSIDELGPLSPPLALALVADARKGLDALHQHGMTHGALRPKRVRVRPNGHTALAMGLDAELTTREEEVATLARILLEPALADPLLTEVLSSADEHALDVALDRILELEPRLDDLAHMALLEEIDDRRIEDALFELTTEEEAAALLLRVFEG